MSNTASTSKVFEEIAKLTNDEKTELYKFFIDNPDKLGVTGKVFTFLQDEEKIDLLRNLAPSMFFHSRPDRVMFANNTEYLLILCFFFPASYRQTRPKTHSRYRSTTCCW